ncbi:universal stress protein [Kineosporia succinea]|uniref:Nucleotide-binding universal stress UspA family protein n=1 Tax=Kineosporia succinea TaxID=84632 RepID=A0ABT9PES5_9ACTN|nr:universal stress protein [Kineosporia succinea]MDP9831001.1 nucleotide-binding universal stress UspA family protein [Kineosporia succinea]
MFERVLVAVDDSVGGDHAFGVARAMVNRELGHELTVVHVARSVNGRMVLSPEERDLRERLAQTVSRLLGEGVKSRLETVTAFRGGPAFAIAEVAEQVDAEVIVVGTRAGEVASRLVRTAGRPVLTVPLPVACFAD